MLSKIQTSLKVHKGQTNDFGKYNYRSCEDILEALKPLLEEHDASLIISDEIVLVGDRYYIKATATLFCGDTPKTAVAYAREPLQQKGMNDAQLTGATSSYARKYALNGLFAIDDTKDADTQDNTYKPHRFKAGEQEALETQVRECLGNGDEVGLKQIFSEYSEDAEVKGKVWALFTSTERSAMKKLLTGE